MSSPFLFKANKHILSDISGKIKIFDLKKNVISEFNPSEKHNEGITDLRFPKDGKFLLSCGEDRTIRIWDIYRRGSLIKTIDKLFDKPIISVDFNDDDTKIVACSSMELKLINVASSGDCLIHEYSKAFHSEKTKALLNGVGTNILLLQNENVIMVIDSKTGEEKSVILTDNNQDQELSGLKDKNPNNKKFNNIAIRTVDEEDYFAVCYEFPNASKMSGVSLYIDYELNWSAELGERVKFFKI